MKSPRNRFKHILSLALAAMLALPLGLTPLNALAEGGYREQELALPGGYGQSTNPTSLPSGGFAVAAQRTDTGAWELLAFAAVGTEPTVTPLDSSPGEIAGITVAPDGQLAATLSGLPSLMGRGQGGQGDAGQPQEQRQPQRVMMTPDSMQTTVVWYDATGAVSAQFTVSGMLLSATALEGQRLAALSMDSGVTVYDAAGKAVQTMPRNDILNMAAGADSLYLIQEGKITQTDLSGNTLRTIPWTLDYSGRWAVAPDGALYLASALGIYRLGPQDAEMAQVTDAARYLFGAPDSGLSSLCALADGSLVARFGGGGFTMTSSRGGTSVRIGNAPGDESAKLVAYLFDAQMNMGESTDFTVTALRDNSKLRKAVSDFQRAHPELTVRLNAALAETDTDTPAEDAIRTLNTDLLAGKGGDVLILDELPIRQYIARGVLTPLDDALAGIGFLPGIVSGSRAADGKLYAMPTQFTLSTLWGRKSQVEGVDSLQSLTALPLDNAQDLLSSRTPEELFELFYPASQSAFLDSATGKPRFDTPEFEAFLELLYQIYAAQAAPSQASTREAAPGRMMNPEEMQGMMNNAIALMAAEIAGTMQVAMPYTAAGDAESLCLTVPSLNGASLTYTPALMAGINAGSAHPDLAQEFLRLLYSPEIQELNQMDGLPVVAASLDKLFDDARTQSKDQNIRMMISTGSGNPIEMKQPNDVTWDALRAICDTLAQPYLADATLMGFMVEETAAFFDGQGTARDVALALQQRAVAYLNE